MTETTNNQQQSSNITLEEYKKRLEAFDWYYDFIDGDRPRWQRAKDEHKELLRLTEEQPEFAKMYVEIKRLKTGR
jgi:hypothetical protein